MWYQHYIYDDCYRLKTCNIKLRQSKKNSYFADNVHSFYEIVIELWNYNPKADKHKPGVWHKTSLWLTTYFRNAKQSKVLSETSDFFFIKP